MNPTEQIIEAERLLAEGLHQAAVDLLSEVLHDNPRHIAAHQALARVRFAQGHRSWGYSLLKRAGLLEQELVSAGAEADPVELADGEDSDVAFADEMKNALLGQVDFFSESEHDPFVEDVGERTAATAQSAALEEAEQPSTRTLTLNRRSASRRQRHVDQRRSSGPEITWKGRSRIGRKPVEKTALADPQPSAQPRDEVPQEELGRDDEHRSDAAHHAASARTDAGLEDGVDDHMDPSAASTGGDADHPAAGPLLIDQGITGGMAPAEILDDNDDVEPEFDLGDWAEVADDLPPSSDVPEEILEDEVGERPAVDASDFDWSEVDVSFDGEENDEAYEQAVSTPDDAVAASGRLGLTQRAEQIALNLLLVRRLVDDPRQAKQWLRTLTRILLEVASGSRSPERSLPAQRRRLNELMAEGISIEEIAAAHACRQAWAENPEFHIDLGGYVRGEGWKRKEGVAHLFPWKSAIGMAQLFRTTEIEEFHFVLFSMYETWMDCPRLQRMFPIFRRYVYYRLVSTGDELDEQPYWLFDDIYQDPLDQWEDDPVERPLLREWLEANRLIPDYLHNSLDPPSRARLVVKGREQEGSRSLTRRRT